MCPKAVFLLADDKLASDEFYRYELQSTTFKLSDVTNIYIYFTKSRSGNATFFNWLTENVMLNWVLEIQQECSPDNNHAMVCMDGEHDQIESFKKDSISSLLNEIISMFASYRLRQQLFLRHVMLVAYSRH